MNPRNEILWTVFREQDLTQREFAKRVGMKRANNISLWLSDQQDISFRKLEYIVGVFGYKLDVKLEKK